MIGLTGCNAMHEFTNKSFKFVEEIQLVNHTVLNRNTSIYQQQLPAEFQELCISTQNKSAK